MKAVIQRVTEASITVNNQVVGQIGAGLLVLLGIGVGDRLAEATLLAEKIANIRAIQSFGAGCGQGGAGDLAVHALRRYPARPAAITSGSSTWATLVTPGGHADQYVCSGMALTTSS